MRSSSVLLLVAIVALIMTTMFADVAEAGQIIPNGMYCSIVSRRKKVFINGGTWWSTTGDTNPCDLSGTVVYSPRGGSGAATVTKSNAGSSSTCPPVGTAVSVSFGGVDTLTVTALGSSDYLSMCENTDSFASTGSVIPEGTYCASYKNAAQQDFLVRLQVTNNMASYVVYSVFSGTIGTPRCGQALKLSTKTGSTTQFEAEITADAFVTDNLLSAVCDTYDQSGRSYTFAYDSTTKQLTITRDWTGSYAAISFSMSQCNNNGAGGQMTLVPSGKYCHPDRSYEFVKINGVVWSKVTSDCFVVGVYGGDAVSSAFSIVTASSSASKCGALGATAQVMYNKATMTVLEKNTIGYDTVMGSRNSCPAGGNGSNGGGFGGGAKAGVAIAVIVCIGAVVGILLRRRGMMHRLSAGQAAPTPMMNQNQQPMVAVAVNSV